MDYTNQLTIERLDTIHRNVTSKFLQFHEQKPDKNYKIAKIYTVTPKN